MTHRPHLLMLLFACLSAGPVASGQTPSEPSGDVAYEELEGSAELLQSHYAVVKNVIRATRSSVAHIEAKKRQKTLTSDQDGAGRIAVVEEAGSGVVIRYRDRNFIVTNHHVVEDCDVQNIRVEVDGKFFKPTDVKHDPETDLAVLFAGRSDLSGARLGDSQKVEIGDFVVAVGSPFGLSHSVSYGIISAKGRRDLELGPQGVRYQDFFQTDAAINPGNSGGPLINLRGEVIGINTAIASNSGGSDGIGFTIPIQMVRRVATDLVDFGRVRRGFLGVSLDARYSPDKALAIGLDVSYGTRVSGVTPKSPAAQAEFQIGDVILEYGDVRIQNDSHLVTEVSLSRIGDNVPVKIFRAGRIRTVSVKIQDRSSFDAQN